MKETSGVKCFFGFHNFEFKQRLAIDNEDKRWFWIEQKKCRRCGKVIRNWNGATI